MKLITFRVHKNSRHHGLSIILLTFVSFFPLASFNPSLKDNVNDKARNYQVQIARESYLVINGSTNIDNFSCSYNGNFLNDTLSVVAVLNGDHLTLTHAQLRLRTAYFECSNRLMNEDFQDLLEEKKYPYIIIKVVDINKNNQEIKARFVSMANNDCILLTTRILIAGKENSYEFPVNIVQNQDERFYSGHLNLNIRDFGLVPPKKMLGLVRVKDVVSIDFKVRISLI